MRCFPAVLPVFALFAAVLGPVGRAADTGFENLLPTPSFEADGNQDGVADGWSKNIHAGAVGSFRLDPDRHRKGRFSQHIIHADESREWVRVSVLEIPAKGETTYQVAGWVSATGPWSVLLYEFPRAGEEGYRTHTVANGGSTDWFRIGKTITTEEGASHLKLSLITTGKGEAWFDDFVLGRLDQLPALRIPTLSAAPTLDGILDEAAWGEAAEIEGLFLLGGNGGRPAAATSVRVGYHEGVLFVGWRNNEPRMADLRLSQPPGWGDDTVELFLSPDETGAGYHHFGLTPAGGKLRDHRRGQVGSGYYSDWFSSQTTSRTAAELGWDGAAARGDDHWTGEMAVRVGEAAEALRPGQVWRIQFARSRKTGDLEQNSCWSYTPGETFHLPERFGKTVFPVYGNAQPRIVSVRRVRPHPLRVVPRPRRLVASQDPVRGLRNPVRIAVSTPGEPAAAVRVLASLLEGLGLSVELQALSAPGRADLVLGDPGTAGMPASLVDELREATARLKPWQIDEAYAVDSSGKTAAIVATGERGLLYGVQTLRQLLYRDGDSLRLHPVRVIDWPDLEWRGWHLIAPSTSAAVPAAKRVIDVLAALKMNWVAFQIDGRLQYTNDPELSAEGAHTKAELAELVRHAEGYGMEVIPMTQCWSHFRQFLGKAKYRHLAEVQDPEPDARWKYWNYCPRNPETHKMLFGMIEEQLECFPNAKYFHCGLDEITFEPIGVCERCKGSSGGDLLAEEVNRLHEFVKSKGLTMCMWGDQLLEEHNGKPPYNTARAIDKIPKDIVIFDWHYAPWKEFPSVEFFKKHGFPVVASGWYEPLNVITFSRTAFDQGVLGYGGTTWYNIERIRD